MKTMKNIKPAQHLALALLLLPVGMSEVHAQSVLWKKSYRPGFPNDPYPVSVHASSAKIGPNAYVHVGQVSTQSPNEAYPRILLTNAQGDSTGSMAITTYHGRPVTRGGAVDVVGNGDGTFTWTGVVDTLIAGTRYPYLLPVLVKMSGQGQIIWSRSFHVPPGRIGASTFPLPLLRTPDGYVMGANTLDFVNPTGNASLDRQTITKFDNQGRVQWEVRFPAYAANTQNLFVQANGSYVAAGYELVPTPLTTSFSGSLDGRLVEFTHSGDTLRTRRIGVEGDYEAIQKAVPTPDKGVAVFLRHQARLPAGGPTEQRLVKLDSLWRVQWDVSVDASPNPYLWDLAATATGEYLLVGSRQLAGHETGYLARFSASGQRLAFLDVAATPTAETSLTRLVYEPGDPLMAWGAVQLPRPLPVCRPPRGARSRPVLATWGGRLCRTIAATRRCPTWPMCSRSPIPWCCCS